MHPLLHGHPRNLPAGHRLPKGDNAGIAIFYKYKISYASPVTRRRVKISPNDKTLNNTVLNNQDVLYDTTDSIQHYLILSVPKYRESVEKLAEWIDRSSPP